MNGIYKRQWIINLISLSINLRIKKEEEGIATQNMQLS